MGELFPRVGFIVTNSNLEAEQVITIYNGRAEIENRPPAAGPASRVGGRTVENSMWAGAGCAA